MAGLTFSAYNPHQEKSEGKLFNDQILAQMLTAKQLNQPSMVIK